MLWAVLMDSITYLVRICGFFSLVSCVFRCQSSCDSSFYLLSAQFPCVVCTSCFIFVRFFVYLMLFYFLSFFPPLWLAGLCSLFPAVSNYLLHLVHVFLKCLCWFICLLSCSSDSASSLLWVVAFYLFCLFVSLWFLSYLLFVSLVYLLWYTNLLARSKYTTLCRWISCRISP